MYKILVDYDPSEINNKIIIDGVFAAHAHLVGEKDKSFSIFLENNAGKILGGMQASLDTESIYIELLWVDDLIRNQGYGKQLLNTAEQEALKVGCKFSTVDTWDFQAPEFYLKNGYDCIGEIKNYWQGHARIFFRKKLK